MSMPTAAGGYAAGPPVLPATRCLCDEWASEITPAASPPGTPAAAISYLNPLAFISNPAPMVPLTVTQNKNDPTATGFLYAVALADQNGQPQALDLIFDFVSGTKKPGPAS